MAEAHTSNDGHSDTGSPIAALEKLVAETEGHEKHCRRKTLDAVVYVADAWQILVRAEERQIAKAIDTVAQDMFMSSWTPVAVEVFVKHTPVRKARQEMTASHSHCAEVAPEQVTPASAEPANDGDADGGQDQAIESAQWRIAQAWDLLEGLQEEARPDAERIRSLGIASFGETRFRAAMVKARMEKLERLEQDVVLDGGELYPVR